MAWKVEYDNSEHMGGGQWFEVVSGNGERLTWIPYSATDDEKEAARLRACMMAAAPELLDALEECLVWEDRPQIIKEAWAAIRKARGEE